MLTLSRSHRPSSHHSRRGFVASGCDSQHRNYLRIPILLDRGRPNFALTEFSEVRRRQKVLDTLVAVVTMRPKERDNP